MSNNTKYIGLSIGPIFETISQVQATRELWAASYVFSHLMENIARGLQAENAKLKTPYVAKTSPKGAGLYPDRLIYPENGVGLNTGKEVARQVLDGFAVRVQQGFAAVKNFNHLDGEVPELESIKGQFKKYFRTYLVESPVDEGKNIRRLSNHLDTLEQYPQFEALPHRNYFIELLGHLKKSKKLADQVLNILFQDAPPIPSMGEIATAGLPGLLDTEGKAAYEQVINEWKKEEQKSADADDDLMHKLKGEKEIASVFKAYHKYVAVVRADGDKIGDTIGALEGVEGGVEAFSQGLYEIGEASVKVIEEYGALPVYAGGDDLLFFAPVCHPDENDGQFKSVFHLVEKLDKKFRNKFAKLFNEWEKKFGDDFKRPDKLPSLSFGISINYYKFPLSEAIESSYHLLNNHAKTGNKNKVAIELLLASGTSIKKTFSLKRAASKKTGKPLASMFSVFSNLMKKNRCQGRRISKFHHLFNGPQQAFVPVDER